MYYVIIRGSFDEQEICAISRDRDQAELLRRKYSMKYDAARIEEYPEEDIKEDDLIYYREVIFRPDGSVCDIKTYCHEDNEEICENGIYLNSVRCFVFDADKGNQYGLYVSSVEDIVAEDDAQAVRIASECRSKWMSDHPDEPWVDPNRVYRRF